jgi:hypothetical protein
MKHSCSDTEKLSGRDVSFVDMTAGEDLTPDPTPKERGAWYRLCTQLKSYFVYGSRTSP